MTTPIDQDARDSARSDIEATFFVEAGAGSGKTHTLVDRILSVIDSGERIERIAAITFTERAAAELRDRLRRALHDTADDPTTEISDEARAHRRVAALSIDSAAIGTVHAFARRLLAEHPIEAGLPVTFTVADEIDAVARARDAWGDQAIELLNDHELTHDLELLRSVGVTVGTLRELAEALNKKFDRIDDKVSALPDRIDTSIVRDDVVATLDALLARASECSKDDDKLLEALNTEVHEYTTLLRTVSDDASIVAVLIAGKPTLSYGNKGSKNNWQDIASIRDQAKACAATRRDAATRIIEVSLRRVLARMAQHVLTEANRRRELGELTFNDLLVLARRLVSDSQHEIAVRTELHDRYRRILIDEFQDTDHLQVDLAMRLAADPASAVSLDVLAPLDGRLFTVGDPKQSIYRFRGADLPLYLGVGHRLAVGDDAPGSRLALTTSFRTVEPVLSWVNHVFEQVIQGRDRSQPEYEALHAHRGDPGLRGPAVLQIGAAEHPPKTKIDDVRAHMASDIAQVALAATGTGADDAWEIVTDSGGKEPARLRDIAILLPRRTALQAITDSLDNARIPYRTESSGLVYQASEVIAITDALRAVAYPEDQLALVHALRSMLFGCGDDDLLRFKAAGGRWDITADLPGDDTLSADHPVVESIAFLKNLLRIRHTASVSQIVELVVRERRLLELATVETRARDMWRRLRYLVEQARQWSTSVGGSLHEFVAWLDAQRDNSSRVQEAILPELDDDAVRLLTVHASKGLEFPIVVVAGLANLTPIDNSDGDVRFIHGQLEVSAGSSARSLGWQQSADEENNRAWDELRRLLYVACTRARDHLVVSTHRIEVGRTAKADMAHQIAQAGAESNWDAWIAPNPPLEYGGGSPEPEPANIPDHDEFISRLDAAVARTQQRRVVAARNFAAGSPPDTDDEGASIASMSVEADPVTVVRRGADARAIGRAVHAVLEHAVDFDPDAVPVLATIHARIEGIASQHTAIVELATHLLASDPVREAAAASRSWRELYVCAELEGQLVEGVVDLMYEMPNGLVIVDYKTDALTPEAFDAERTLYDAQVRTYARLVEAATGRNVSRCILLHALPDRCRVLDVTR